MPGSGMILTPESDGKYLSNDGLITLVISRFKLYILRSRKATTNIKQIHVETNLSLESRKLSQSARLTSHEKRMQQVKVKYVI